MIEPSYPLTEEQRRSLADYQKAGAWHPYACPRGHGPLAVDSFGLLCDTCAYKQSMVHAWTIDGSWRDVLAANITEERR